MKLIIAIFFKLSRLSTHPLTIGLGCNLQLELNENNTDFAFVSSSSHDPYHQDSSEILFALTNVEEI